jgi:hypothetical protein
MKAFKLILIVFLFLTFLVVKGQEIRNCDLYGEWSIDQGRNKEYLNFISDSGYYYKNYADSANKRDYYNLLIKKGQTILSLYTLTGTYLASWRPYFIRKINDGHFMLQVPSINYETYEIVSYEWENDKKENTFDLFRIE